MKTQILVSLVVAASALFTGQAAKADGAYQASGLSAYIQLTRLPETKFSAELGMKMSEALERALQSESVELEASVKYVLTEADARSFYGQDAYIVRKTDSSTTLRLKTNLAGAARLAKSHMTIQVRLADEKPNYEIYQRGR